MCYKRNDKTLLLQREYWEEDKRRYGKAHIFFTKKEVGLIVNRRNLIAHESDRNRVTGELQAIDLDTVIQCKNFGVKLVNQFETLLAWLIKKHTKGKRIWITQQIKRKINRMLENF